MEKCCADPSVARDWMGCGENDEGIGAKGLTV